MQRNIKGILVLTFGILFTLIGIVSFVVPLVPGWLFVAIGILLLSLYFPRLRDWIDTHTKRWPKLHARIHRLRVWADANIGKL